MTDLPTPETQTPPAATPDQVGGRVVGPNAFFFIFITVMIDMMSIGLILPVLAPLVVALTGAGPAKGAEMFGWFGVAWAVMQFFFMPILGGLSDAIGRRPVILLSNLGLGLDYVLMALAPGIGLLFLGRLISGAFAASVSTAGAFIADVTPPEQRAQRFGMLGAAFGLGFVLGPVLGGMLGKYDPRAPFWAAAALSGLNFLYGLFVLPESLPKSRRRPFKLRQANPFGAFKLLQSQQGLLDWSMVKFLAALAHASLPAVFVLMAGQRFQWHEAQIGLTLGLVGISAVVVQGGLVGPIVKRIGERMALTIGLLSGAIAFSIYAFAPTVPIFLCGIFFGALWGMADPSLQSLMSKSLPPDRQGQLQGALGGIVGLASIFGPLLFTQVFAYATTHANPERLGLAAGAPFAVASVLLLSAAMIAILAMQRHRADAALAAKT